MSRRLAQAGAAGRSRPTRTRWLLVAALGFLVLPSTAAAQAYPLTLPRGDTLTFPLDTLKRMMTEARRFRDILERDPHVLYVTGIGPAATDTVPGPAYPWNAVRVRNDSVAEISTPANLREMDKAYANYAVETMTSLRSEGPAGSCEQVVGREVEHVSTFLDGWTISRTLYGGPPFEPVDAMVFARADGHLPAMLVALRDSQLVGCADAWRKDHASRMEAYRSWRLATLGASSAPADTATSPDTAAARADTTVTAPDTAPAPPDTAAASPESR